MTYATEFPDFDPATLPATPVHWTDASWHNDCCPCWSVAGLTVFIDYADKAKREVAETVRYCIIDFDLNDVGASDDWADIIALVTAHEAAASGTGPRS